MDSQSLCNRIALFGNKKLRRHRVNGVLFQGKGQLLSKLVPVVPHHILVAPKPFSFFKLHYRF